MREIESKRQEIMNLIDIMGLDDQAEDSNENEGKLSIED
jgi:hypothetical protein